MLGWHSSASKRAVFLLYFLFQSQRNLQRPEIIQPEQIRSFKLIYLNHPFFQAFPESSSSRFGSPEAGFCGVVCCKPWLELILALLKNPELLVDNPLWVIVTLLFTLTGQACASTYSDRYLIQNHQEGDPPMSDDSFENKRRSVVPQGANLTPCQRC